jgi:hypothetical protein
MIEDPWRFFSFADWQQQDAPIKDAAPKFLLHSRQSGAAPFLWQEKAFNEIEC